MSLISCVHSCCKPSRLLQYGALIIVVMYTVLGAYAFQALEYDYQLAKVERDRNRFRRCIGNTLRFTLPSMTDRYEVTARQLDVNCFKPPSAISYWSFENAVLFAFCVCTTIGYGHLVPETANGRLFCSFYAIIGVPLTMIAIANIGKYISDSILWIERILRKIICRKKQRAAEETKAKDEEDETKSRVQGDRLVIAFILYLALGSELLSLWETDMTYFVALYFNIQSLTTMGFGDLWPKNEYFMWLSLLYMTLGLAIASIALSVFSDYLRQLHYFGQRIQNARQTVVKVGGSNVTVGRLLTIVSAQLGVEPEELENLNLEAIVEHETKKLEPTKKLSMLPTIRQAQVEIIDFEGPPPTTPRLSYDAEKITETKTNNESECIAKIERVTSNASLTQENDRTSNSNEEEPSSSAMSQSSHASRSPIPSGRRNKIPIRKKEEPDKPKWSHE